jgi:hypothetical protein
MNIFILDLDVHKNATYYCDRHISKMILETAQILSSALTLLGVNHNGYACTHVHHPCVTWARDLRNWVYLRSLGRALGEEYTHRYGKVHKSIGVINGLPIPEEMTVAQPRNYVLAMPLQYHQYLLTDDDLVLDPVASYRAYYKSKQDKFKMTWTKRRVPFWFN